MKINHILPKTIVSVLVCVMLACNGGTNSDNQVEEVEVLPEDIVELRDDQIILANIETGTIDSLSLGEKLKVSGIVTVSAQNLATVCMPSGGFIKSVNLMPGDPIIKGQPLARIENQEFVNLQQSYMETKIKFEYAEIEYIRHSELYLDEVYSQNNVQLVTSEYKSLKTQLHALEQKLKLVGINPENLKEENISNSVMLVSPISGYVKTVNVNIGRFVGPTDILFEIVNPDKLLLELTLFEKDAAKVSPGQKINFFINNETEQHDAVIYQTAKSISSDKTYKVYANVPNVCKNVLPGMYVNAIIETSSNRVLALPSDAIVSFDDKLYIFIFHKNKEENGRPFTEYQMVEVHKGASNGGFTEVGFQDGFIPQSVKVVVKGAYNLLSAKKNAGEMSC